MPEEYFGIAYINFDKAILHGRITGEMDEYRCRKEYMVEQVLTDEQKRQVEDLSSKHDLAMQRLLASFVDREAVQENSDAE